MQRRFGEYPIETSVGAMIGSLCVDERVASKVAMPCRSETFRE